MKWMSLNELRERYLSFFESKGHLRLGSFSLVPNNDKSLLLINSGMAPMKKYFTGEVTPPRSRVTTCQKCIRTPDLERVGITARHGTYFEMLGNFSFGDYFKKEAIPWAWEFLTKDLEIPAELLWPSVYEEDDEAYALWRDVIGVPEERIVKLGKADNFWEHGTGPCGPCSEIYFDRGEKYGCGSPDCKPGCECDRYMEIWNNVFTQFNNMGDGTYTELEHKNIDTGMGLERLACVMQGVDNMFEVDTIRNILDKVCEISGKTYGQDQKVDISIRAITDHARASTFMISDGIIPSNEGRGYVLRRLIRRAARHGRLIGIDRAFLVEMVEAVIKENASGYPELIDKQELIKKVIANEEASFSKTIDQGLTILADLTTNGGTLSGEDAFRLYDTYGFPLDLTRDILAEKGMTVDEDGFNTLMQQQREKARNARKASDGESWSSDGINFDDIAATEFLGYTQNECVATVLDIVVEGEHVSSAMAGQKAIVVLDKTVFYAESGGQVGDSGAITGFDVVDTKKTVDGIFTHIGTATNTITVGDKVNVKIDIARREAIRRNHTAAHLLQAALRQVLGTHVEQAGQLVNEKAVRFDFTHFSALTAEETQQVETLVNTAILDGIVIDNREMPIDEARALGAMALFGEKYGDIVRVVKAGDFSTELCGGTHVDNTGKIGLFRIISESGIAAGTRRIEAYTGFNVVNLINHYKSLLADTAATLKIGNIEDVATKAAATVKQMKEDSKKIESLEAKLASGKLNDLMANAIDINGVKVATAKFDGTAPDELRKMIDTIKAENDDAVAVLAAVNGEKLTFCAGVGKAALAKGAHAGNIVKAVAQIAGGNGGGKPDSAMAGGKEIAKADEALAAVSSIVEGQLK
ncbi:MAG: alanine--tRNA ligase [Clostridia bacterium]|nr:alanine--tRNA ligase [Clostridia bacterium]MBR4117253.1 alanine--tRNA ligase [Clostridia bacterium]